MLFEKKDFYLKEFSQTMQRGENRILSFYNDIDCKAELDILFSKATKNYGVKHFGIFRLCDAEYIYCVGRKTPPQLSFARKVKYRVKTFLVNTGLIRQKTGHENKMKKEFWFGENYSLKEKREQWEKFLADVRQISLEGFLSPYLMYSRSHFAEEYFEPMLSFFKSNNIELSQENYFPFFFVYVMLNLSPYKDLLFRNKDILIVTSFNERNKKENFSANLEKENIKSLSFYNISHNKAMLEKIDKSKLPHKVDLVLIGAGIGSANIINQLTHLNALCIDAGHALDCISRPELRQERMGLLPDDVISQEQV